MPQDPDASVVALFRNHAQKNELLSAKEGRPIFEDWEVCELRYPGSRNVGVYPATSFSHWAVDPATGEQVKVTYAERFPRQYQQFKMMATQTKAGTPLTHAPFLTEARRAEFRALNIYTVEQLANIDGIELKNLGSGGRDLKNKAIEYLNDAKNNSGTTQLAAELEALRARNEMLEEDLKLLKERASSDDEFDGMTLEQLRDFIATNTGHPVQGAGLNRKTLVRMAQEARPSKVA
jgi:hypothetical protein